jgi:hypothetical protein
MYEKKGLEKIMMKQGRVRTKKGREKCPDGTGSTRRRGERGRQEEEAEVV